MEEGEVTADLKMDTETNAGLTLVSKTEIDEMNGEPENCGAGELAILTPDGDADGDPTQPLAITNGEGTSGLDVNRRRSTRMRKEPTPLIQEMPGPSKPPGTHTPRYRFFRPPPRVYKPSALVDRLWTIQEREKLLDAVSKVAIDDYASIADIIGNTRSPAEVRDYLKRIQARTKELEGQRYSALFDEKRHPHSRHLLVKEEGEAIERWLRVIDHLVSDNDATDYSKVIPDVFAVIANLEQNPDPGTIKGKRKKQEDSESSTSPNKEGGNDNGDDDDDDDSIAPVNYKIIYEYLYALLRGLTPPSLDPIESWVMLDLISDTATELKGSDLDAQKDYLRCIYRDYCNKTLNMKWCNTSKMIVPITEEIAVVSKRRKMEAKFSGYLSKKDREREGDASADVETASPKGASKSANLTSPGPSTSANFTSPKHSTNANLTSPKASTSGLTTSPKKSLESVIETLQRGASSTNLSSSLNVGAPPQTSTSSVTTSGSELKPEFTNGHSNGEAAEIHPLATFIKDDPTYHNIMIGGLNVTKDAEDLGSFFTLNPLGVPTSILNPKMDT